MAPSAYLGYQGARSAIQAGRLSRLYVMWGDSFLTGRLIALLKARLVAPGAEDFDFAVIDAASTSPAELLTAVRSAPFLSQRRLTVLERVRCLKARGRQPAESAEDAEAASEAPAPAGEDPFWDAILADPPPTSCVVALLEGQPDARLRLTKAVLARGQFVECAPSGRDAQALAGEVVREAVAEHKLKMGWRAQGLLVSTAGTDFGQLSQEVEKLSLYCGDRPVTEEDVLLLVPRTAQADIWQLLDAVEGGKPAEAHRIIRAAFARGESAVALVASLASQLRIMARASERSEAGVPLTALPGVLGANRFWVEQSLRRARLFPLSDLYQAIRELARIDLGIKTGMVEPEAGVEAFVLSLCANRVPLASPGTRGPVEKWRGTDPAPQVRR